MGLTVRKLVFNGDTRDGRRAFARIYDGLIQGWTERKADGLRALEPLVDMLQSISQLRRIPDEALAMLQEQARAQQGLDGFEQSEHDRELLPGTHELLLSDADYKKLKSCFDRVDFDARQLRAVAAARAILESAPLVEVEEKKAVPAGSPASEAAPVS